jgi:hypothetical protein
MPNRHSLSLIPRIQWKTSQKAISDVSHCILWRLLKEVRDIIYENILDEDIPVSRLSRYEILYTNKRLSAEFSKHYYESRLIAALQVRTIRDLDFRTPIKSRYFMDYCRLFHLTVRIDGCGDSQAATHFVKYRSSLLFRLHAMMKNVQSLRELIVGLTVTCPHPSSVYAEGFQKLHPQGRNATLHYKKLRIRLRKELTDMVTNSKVIRKFTYRDLDAWTLTRASSGEWVRSVERYFLPKPCNLSIRCASCAGGVELDSTK